VTSKNGATVFALISGGVSPAKEGDTGPASKVIKLNEIAWIDALPGVRQKPIFSDKETHRRAIVARFEPGAKLGRHRHVGDEIVFVIEGSNADESGELVAGNMNYRPNGCTHSVWSTNGATALAFVTGSVEPACFGLAHGQTSASQQNQGRAVLYAHLRLGDAQIFRQQPLQRGPPVPAKRPQVWICAVQLYMQFPNRKIVNNAAVHVQKDMLEIQTHTDIRGG